MSREAVELILKTALEKSSFSAQLGSDPSLIEGYDLTVDERKAILSRDEDSLRRLGVDERLLPGLKAIGGSGSPGTATTL